MESANPFASLMQPAGSTDSQTTPSDTQNTPLANPWAPAASTPTRESIVSSFISRDPSF